jgi:hypothetical protein
VLGIEPRALHMLGGYCSLCRKERTMPWVNKEPPSHWVSITCHT